MNAKLQELKATNEPMLPLHPADSQIRLSKSLVPCASYPMVGDLDKASMASLVRGRRGSGSSWSGFFLYEYLERLVGTCQANT